MVEHYAELSGEPINWRWLMREIAERGLTNRSGKPPPLGTAKRTWFRVVAMMRSGCQPTTKPEARPVLSTRSADPSTGRSQPSTMFGFATIKPKKE